MVTVDPSQDYYADLELSPDCTTEDVKKQYRKLALQFHPDRHRGQEAEYNAKFQAISAAHDVLMDPEKRAKYDLNRRRGNVNSNSFARPPPPRRSAPRQDPVFNYPPPPRRTGPRPASGAPPFASSGAERYAHFGTPPRPHRQNHSKTASEKAAGFKAWQQMDAAFTAQKSSQPPNHRHNVPPPYGGPRRDPADFADEGPFARNRRDSNSPPLRSAYAEFRRHRPPPTPQESSNRVPRRSGFDPTSSGDEAPAPASKYRNSFSQQEGPPPTPPNGFSAPPPPPRNSGPNTRQQDHHDPTRTRSGDEVPFTEGESRTSKPYTSQKKDRTYLSGESLRRSASTRDATRLGHSPERPGRQGYFGPSERHRSASPMSSTVSGGVSPGEPKPKSGRQRPFQPFISYSSSEESDESEPGGENTYSRPADDDASPSSSNVSSDSKSDEPPINRPKSKPSDSWAQRSGRTPMNKSRSFDSDQPDSTGRTHEGHAPEMKRSNTVFGAPLDKNAFEGSSNVNLGQPVNGEPSTNRANPNANQSQGRPIEPSRARSSPDIRSAVEDELQNLNFNPNEAAASNVGEKKFGETTAQATSTSDWAQKWTKNLREESWATGFAAPSPQRPHQGSMARPSRVRKPVAQPVGTPKPATVEDETIETEDPPKVDGEASALYDQIVVEEDPMDVDSPSGSKERSAPTSDIESAEVGNGPRNPFVESSRPGNSQQDPSDPESLPRPQSMRAPPPPPRRPSPGFIMSSLRHVEPFDVNASGSGLHGMSDLKTDLPFESKASSQHPTRNAPGRKEGEFEYIKPPRAPLQPQKLTQTSWQFHLAAMGTYLSAWNAWNARMVSYFQDSAVKQLEMEKGEGMVKNWLSAVGETEKLGGWDTYLAEMKKEDAIQARWNVAREKHWKAIDMHTKLRNHILKNGIPP